MKRQKRMKTDCGKVRRSGLRRLAALLLAGFLMLGDLPGFDASFEGMLSGVSAVYATENLTDEVLGDTAESGTSGNETSKPKDTGESEGTDSKSDDSETENSKTEGSETDGSEMDASEKDCSESEVSETDDDSKQKKKDETDLTAEESTEKKVAGSLFSKEQAAAWKKAQESLKELTASKEVMGVVYLTDYYDLRTESSKTSGVVTSLPSATTVLILEAEINETEKTLWYLVTVDLDDHVYTGYIEDSYLVSSDELFLQWKEEAQKLLANASSGDADGFEPGTENGVATEEVDLDSLFGAGIDADTVSYSDVECFPGSYQAALKALKNAHPNWTFVPQNTGLDFQTSVNAELGEKSYIYSTAPANYKGNATSQKNWYYATAEAVSYYMDPRNFLSESYIFQFEQLTYNASYHTEAAIQSFLNGTFMKGTIPGEGMTYAHAFYLIGSSRGISPTHLASRVYQEQGAGTSAMISGTYSGYVGYYNYFNVGAGKGTTQQVLANGLSYAKSKGWNTRYKSLEGGAATIGNNYILKKQDTSYLQKFNVSPYSSSQLYSHQYMQNIQAPASESTTTKKMYAQVGSLNSPFVFKIPVYLNMPGDNFSISPSTLTINKGREKILNPMVGSSAVSASNVTWSLQDNAPAEEVKKYVEGGASKQVATISSDGRLSALYSGTITVKGVYKVGTKEEQTAYCKVTIKAPLETITLSSESSFWQTIEGKQTLDLERTDCVDWLMRARTEDAGASRAIASGTMVAGVDSVQIDVAFTPADTTDSRTITWTSSNTAVAKVVTIPDAGGAATVNAVGVGTSTVTAKCGNCTSVFTVTVTSPITAVGLTENGGKLLVEAKKESAPEASDQLTALSMTKGEQKNLFYTYLPADTAESRKVTWSSSDESVATVENGVVTATGNGTAEITAVSQGKYRMQTSCHVTVSGCNIRLFDREKKEIGDGGSSDIIWDAEQKALADALLDLETGESLGKLPTPGDRSANGVFYKFMGWYTLKDPAAAVERSNLGKCYAKGSKILESELDLYAYYEPIADGFVVMPVGTYTYTGSAIKPDVVVYDSQTYQNAIEDGDVSLAEPLEPGVHYTVRYTGNVKVNTASATKAAVIVQGKGLYTGTSKVIFEIEAKSLSDKDVSVTCAETAYTGKKLTTSPKVMVGSKKLTAGTDYTVSYPWTGAGAYVKPGTYPVRITGKGNYTGVKTAYLVITDDILMSKVSVAAIPAVSYQSNETQVEGVGIRPSLTLKYTKSEAGKNGNHTWQYSGNLSGNDGLPKTEKWTLDGVEMAAEEVPFTLLFSGNKETGTARVTIKAKADLGFVGSIDRTFKINGIVISRASVSGIANQEWKGADADYSQNGMELRYGGTLLTENVDYKAIVSPVTKTGTATVTIQGMGGFTGSVKKTFRVTAVNLKSAQDISVANGSDHTGERFCWNWSSELGSLGMTGFFADHGGQSWNSDSLAVSADYALGELPARKNYAAQAARLLTANETLSPGDAPTIYDLYLKGGNRPILHLYDGGTELIQGKDYTISYRQNTAVTGSSLKDAKCPYLTITGKGNYAGTLECGYAILDGGLDLTGKLSVTAGDVTYRCTKGFWKITPVVTDRNGKKLTAGSDYQKNYRYTYENDTTAKTISGRIIGPETVRNAGDIVGDTDLPAVGSLIRVSVTGKGNYAGTWNGVSDPASVLTGSGSCVYRVIGSTIAGASVTVKNQTYTGRAISLDRELSSSDITPVVNPQIAVKVGKTELKAASYAAYRAELAKGTKVSELPFDYVIVGYDIGSTASGLGESAAPLGYGSSCGTVGYHTVTLMGVGSFGGIKTVRYQVLGRKIK